MSGSPGSSSSWNDVPPPDTSCDRLVINTQLSSPRADVIAQIRVGDRLDVALESSRRDVVVVLHQGQLAGGLASPELSRLRDCLNGGTVYQAEVTEINGGQVRIRVTAVGA